MERGSFSVRVSPRDGEGRRHEHDPHGHSPVGGASPRACGRSCQEAESVVRKVGGPLGSVNGAARGEADGFTCVRTSQQEGQGLSSARYECTRGSQRITLTRT